MPRGHAHDPLYSLSIKIWSFDTVLCVYFSGKRRSLLHPNKAQRSSSYYNLILRKLKEKMPRKALVNTKRPKRIMCSWPLGIL